MSNIIFRTGKYKGKTLEFVQETNPNYIRWVEENRPEMLKEPKVKNNTKTVDYKPTPITPNYNFDNETD